MSAVQVNSKNVAVSTSEGVKTLLTVRSGLPHGAIPFDRFAEADYEPAFDEALAAAKGAISRVAQDFAAPTFENTMESLEFASEPLDHVATIFSNALSAHTSEGLQAVASRVLPRLAEFSNDVYLNAELFGRLRTLKESPSASQWSREQSRLFEKTWLAFTRNGALLDQAGKKRIREIDARLAVLGQQFGDHVLKATHAFELVLRAESELEGLPERQREAAQIAARERGHADAWLITLQQPSYVPFMRYSKRRELREKLWRAFTGRASRGDHDNRALCIEIAGLRDERARLLGYATHAAYVLEERMAAKPDTVRRFLDRLISASRPAADRDVALVREQAAADGVQLKPWDFEFYAERLRKEKFSLDEDALRAYFPLGQVLEGAFELARRLYGLEFRKSTDLPVYHPEVEAYEVTDKSDGGLVGVLYADFFPRASKRPGAWMTVYHEQGLWSGGVDRPHVAIVLNLPKATPSTPSLLGMDDVRTVFHEFGHALHGLLSKVRYRSLAGTQVYWDFVELPSQIMENWVRESEGLRLFARHYQTGEPISDEWVERIRRVQRFLAGYYSIRQLNFAALDLAWHDGVVSIASPEEVAAFENRSTESTRVFSPEPGAMVSTSFSHIFSGGYSAGYYSYKWAEVLDADAFELFQERGIFDGETARKFRDCILSRGGTEHPAELYRKFRGREPDPDALLRRDGLI